MITYGPSTVSALLYDMCNSSVKERVVGLYLKVLGKFKLSFLSFESSSLVPAWSSEAVNALCEVQSTTTSTFMLKGS